MDHETRKVTFPAKAWIASGVFGLLQVGLLAFLLLGVMSQRQIVRDQLGVARSNAEIAQPVLRDTRPLVDAARDNLPTLGRAARQASGLVRVTRPLVRELTDNQAAGAIAAAGRLALELSDHEAAHAIATTARLARGLAENDRLLRLVDSSVQLVGELERAGTVESIRDMRGVLHQVLSIQRRTLSAQQQALEIQRSTLATQQEALRHIRSIDRKTGGTLPG